MIAGSYLRLRILSSAGKGIMSRYDYQISSNMQVQGRLRFFHLRDRDTPGGNQVGSLTGSWHLIPVVSGRPAGC
jgi:hypothetical protein